MADSQNTPISSSTTTKKGRTTSTSDTDPPSCTADTHGIMTSTMNDLPGYRIVRILGTIYGLSVRGKNWGSELGAIFKSVTGGEIAPVSRLIYSARNHAVERLVGECMGRGGNAIVALRFDTNELMSFAHVCAYGTACVVEKIE